MSKILNSIQTSQGPGRIADKNQFDALKDKPKKLSKLFRRARRFFDGEKKAHRRIYSLGDPNRVFYRIKSNALVAVSLSQKFITITAGKGNTIRKPLEMIE